MVLLSPKKSIFVLRGLSHAKGAVDPLPTYKPLVGLVVSTDRTVFKKAHCTAFPHGPLRITDPTSGTTIQLNYTKNKGRIPKDPPFANKKG